MYYPPTILEKFRSEDMTLKVSLKNICSMWDFNGATHMKTCYPWS